MTIELGSRWSKPSFPVPTHARVKAIEEGRVLLQNVGGGKAVWWPLDQFESAWRPA